MIFSDTSAHFHPTVIIYSQQHVITMKSLSTNRGHIVCACIITVILSQYKRILVNQSKGWDTKFGI